MSKAPDLWGATEADRWRSALDRYDQVIEAQGVTSLAELDRWYHQELPLTITGRAPEYVTHGEMVRVTEWKMARGVWRGRNLALVKGNSASEVERVSRAALAAVPDPRQPIQTLAKLAGVGPATASAVLAAAAPALYPFFDELVGAQVPGLGNLAFDIRYYAAYAEALRRKAAELGEPWTAARVERALWANAGGKAGLRA